MRVCMIPVGKFQEGDLPPTGADLQAINQIRELRAKGHQVTVVAKKKTRESRFHEYIDGVEIYRMGGPHFIYTFWAPIVIWLNRKKIDVVHVVGTTNAGITSILICHRMRIPCVLKIAVPHKVFQPALFDRLLPSGKTPGRNLINKILREASAYIAISQEIADELIHYEFYPERVHRLRNGVDLKRFFPLEPARKMSLRKELGLPIDKKIILYLSHLSYNKGSDLLFTIGPRILAEYPNTHLLIAGGIRKEKDGITFKKMMDSVKVGSITYLGHVQNPAPYLECSDIFIFPSRKDALPSALLEAMASGCACVASDIGGCIEVIIHEKTGLLFPSGNAEALFENTVRLLKNDNLAKTVSVEAHQLIVEKFELSGVVEDIIKIYEEIISVRK